MALERKSFCVRLLEKEFRVACTPEQEQGLLLAASLLDERMGQILHAGKAMGIERVAVMAALNIAFDFLELKKQNSDNEQVIETRLQVLNDNLDKTFGKVLKKKKKGY